MAENTDWAAVFADLPRIIPEMNPQPTAKPTRRVCAAYLGGEPHNRVDKTTIDLMANGILLLEQGGPTMRLEKYLQQYHGCAGYRAAMELIETATGGRSSIRSRSFPAPPPKPQVQQTQATAPIVIQSADGFRHWEDYLKARGVDTPYHEAQTAAMAEQLQHGTTEAVTGERLWAFWTAPNGKRTTAHYIIPELTADRKYTGRAARLHDGTKGKLWPKGGGPVASGGKGGAVRILPCEGPILGIAEGIEDAVAVMAMNGQYLCGDPAGSWAEQFYGIKADGEPMRLPPCPVWAVCSAGNMSSFEPPQGVKLIVFANKDGAGKTAALSLAKKHRAEILFPPKDNDDWADYLRRQLLATHTTHTAGAAA